MDRHAHPSSVRTYLVVWAALLVLTVLTIGAAQAALGAWALPVALAIAITKASLVALFFMHLRDQRGINRLVPVVALLLLAILIALAVADVVTRFPLARPGGMLGRWTSED